jgi:hypothetical protein
MARELRPIARALGLTRRRGSPTAPAGAGGTRGAGRLWASDHVVAATVGVGPVQAERATSWLLGEYRPRRVLVVGVAGALDSALSVGELMVPEAVLDAATGVVHRPHPPAGGCSGAAGAGPARRGQLVTVARVGPPGARPASWPADALAVDMETAAIAGACERSGVPWDVIRAISDLPGGISPEVASLLRPDGGTNLMAVMRLVGRHPAQIGRLLALGVATNRAVRAASAAALRQLGQSG